MAEGGESREGCAESEGATMRLEEVRTRGRGHKRPARRDARGGAPSFVSFRRASLRLASSSPFSFLPAGRPRIHPVRDVPRTDPLPAISRFPLFARTTVIFCGNPQMWLGRIRTAQLGVCEGWLASLRKASAIDTGHGVRAADAALLHRDELIKKNRGSRADISCPLCSARNRSAEARKGRRPLAAAPHRPPAARGKRKDNESRDGILYLHHAFSRC